MKRLFTTLLMVACLGGLLLAQTPVQPINLQGVANGTTVNLTWEAPEKIFTHTNNNFTYVFGSQEVRFSVAHRYTQADIAAQGISGLMVTKIGVVPLVRGAGQVLTGTTRVKLYVWTPTSGNNPGNYVARHPDNTYNANNASTYIEFNTSADGVWQDITLPNPVTIPSTGELWIGLTFLYYPTNGFCVTMDNMINTDLNKNMLKWNSIDVSGAWQTASSLFQGGMPNNWMIRGTASYPSGRGEPIVFSSNFTEGSGSVDDDYIGILPQSSIVPAPKDAVERFMQSNSPTRAFAGYNVYRGQWGSPNLITLTDTPITALTYTDIGVPDNSLHTYHVTTVTTSPNAESLPVSVDVAVGGDPVISVYPYVQLFDSVPPVFPPLLWTVLSNNQSIADNWILGNHIFLAYSGYGMAISMSWGAGGALDPDEFLITPHFTKPTLSGESMILTFKARNSEDGEWFQRFTVMKSTTGKLVEDFTPIGDQYSLEGTVGWQSFLIDLTNEIADGSNFYIAIRHHDSVDMVVLVIDNVRIDVVPTANITFNAPTNLMSSISGSVVSLTWTAPVNPNVAGYNIYRDGDFLAFTNSTVYVNDVTFNGDYEYEVSTVFEAPPAESFKTSHTATVTTGRRYISDISNVRHIVNAAGDVVLSWDAPQEGAAVAMSQSTGDPNWTKIYQTSDITFGHRYDEDDLQSLGVSGGYLDSVGFWPLPGEDYETGDMIWTSAEYKIMIFTGCEFIEEDADGAIYTNGTLVYEQEIDKKQLNVPDWIDVKLNSPVLIPMMQEIIIAINVRSTALSAPNYTYVAGDNGPRVVDKGDLRLFLDGNYNYSVNYSGQAQVNWLIRATAIKSVSTHAFVNPEAIPTRLSLSKPSKGSLTRTNDNSIAELTRINTGHRGLPTSVTHNTRDGRGATFSLPDAYMVYLGVQGTTPVPAPNGLVTQPSYTATELSPATYQARVTAIYGAAPNQVETNPLSYYFYAGSVTITDFPYFEGFEETMFPPVGWSTYNTVPSNAGWFKYATGTAHEGGAVAATTTQNAMLVSPKLQIPADWGAENARITFMVRRGSDTEMLRVYYATEGPGAESNWVEPSGGQVNVTSPNWVEITRNLPNSVNGSDIWLAIRKTNATNTSGRLEIDSFRIANSISDADESLPALTNALIANYPNPFNPETTIAFSVAKEGRVTLDIYNVKGQKVNALVNDVRKSGLHKVVWNGKDDSGRDVASGIYFYKLNAGSFEDTRKMILMK